MLTQVVHVDDGSVAKSSLSGEVTERLLHLTPGVAV